VIQPSSVGTRSDVSNGAAVTLAGGLIAPPARASGAVPAEIEQRVLELVGILICR